MPADRIDGRVSGSGLYTVSVVRLNCAPGEFKDKLVAAGMSAARVDQVLASIPCTVKANVAQAVAEQYAQVFRGAGGEVLVEPAAAAAKTTEPAPPPPVVPTVNLRGSTPPEASRATEMPGIDLPPDDLPPDEPMQVVSREHGFTADGGGATPRGRFPLHAPHTSPEIHLDAEPPEPHELELAADEPPGDSAPPPALEVAAVDRAASSHARTAAHQANQVSFKVVLPPPPEPWWKRRLPHMITGAILLVIISYVYGCAKVHGRAIDFRREVSNDIRAQLRAPGTEFAIWTPASVEAAARKAAALHHFKVLSVTVTADKICTVKMPVGCNSVYNPLAVSRLDVTEQMQIANGCPKPDWVLTIKVDAKSRWGLYAYEVEEMAYTTISRWSPTEEINGDGRCEENSDAADDPPPTPDDG